MEDHDRGLAYDLPKLMSRRRALAVLAGSLASGALAACGSSSSDSAATTTTGATAEIPDEIAGPYPGDGSNGPNVLTESGIVRSDITKSFGEASGVATGVPTAVEMTLLDVAAGGTPLAGAAVYLWHCNIDGQYSMYDEDVAAENYLRGVQKATCDLVYATDGYERSVQNLAQTSLETDNVFSDGHASQLATASGTADAGITLRLNVGV
jgi:hypothetical protein